MDELLLGLIVLLFKLFAWVFKSAGRLVMGGVRALQRAQSGESSPTVQRQQQQRSERTTIARARLPGVKAAPTRVVRTSGAGTIVGMLDEMARRASSVAELTATEEVNAPLCESVEGFIVPAIFEARAAVQQGRVSLGESVRLVTHLRSLLALVEAMAEQRRDEDLALLLGDSDALAAACYAPLVEYAVGAELALGTQRTLTFLADQDLATFIGLHLGFAPILLPAEWATEIAWWPALIHEVGHAFYGTLKGLDAELRADFRLPRAAGSLVDEPLTDMELWRPFAAWLEELVADAFGVMMMGPAYVQTMMWAFARPRSRDHVLFAGADDTGERYEEHPPAHLRVVLGCRLLAEMGYPHDGKPLERQWRKQHQDPTTIALLARSGRWLSVAEDALIARGQQLVRAIYEGSWAALGSEPLRAIPGFDFGPREHQRARDVAKQLASGHMADTTDPRCLVAGAVLARFDRPSSAAAIARAARASIRALGVTRTRLRVRTETEAARHVDPLDGGLDLTAAAEAILVDAILSPPPSLRARRDGRW